jgi:hypothetical protein
MNMMVTGTLSHAVVEAGLRIGEELRGDTLKSLDTGMSMGINDIIEEERNA